MGNCGASAVFEVACGLGKGLTHKNWRVREGVLSLYARAVEDCLQGGGSGSHAPAAVAVLLNVGNELVLPQACALLSDARPELRKAAVDACAAQALREGLAKVQARAEKAGARATHVKAVEERLVELRSEGGGLVGAGAPSAPSGASASTAVALGAQQAAGPGVTYAASKAEQHQQQQRGGGGGGAFTSVEEALRAEAREHAAPPGSGREGGAATHHSSAPQPLSEGVQQPHHHHHHHHHHHQQQQQQPPHQPPQQLSEAQWAEYAAHPSLASLCHMHSGPWWVGGVLGELGDEVGLCRGLGVGGGPSTTGATAPLKPLHFPTRTGREVGRFLDDFAATCGNTTPEWRARTAALERLRGYVASGALFLPEAGYSPAALARLRDPLCAQVQDLRSQIVRLACTAVGELFSALALTGGGRP